MRLIHKGQKGRVFFIACILVLAMTACGKAENVTDEMEAITTETASVAEIIDATESSEIADEDSYGEESEPESEPETESTTDMQPEMEVEPETDVELENEVKNEVAMLSDEEIELAEIREDMEAVFASVFAYILPDEEAESDPSALISNAILKQTDITINSVTLESCNVTIKYPNALETLKEAEAKLPADATKEQVNEMLKEVVQLIEEDAVAYIEKTFESEIIEYEGIRNIVWSKELYDAVTGGLYSAQ